MKKKISILGAGSWGTALAMLAAKNGCSTLLWGHHKEHMTRLHNERVNQKYLPSIPFPEKLETTDSLEQVCNFSATLMICVPSHAFRQTLIKLQPYTNPKTRIAWATKGLNPDDGAFLHQVTANIFSPETPTAILSGPTFAREVAIDLPTAVTIASKQSDFSAHLVDIFQGPHFRPYTSTDLIGVQLGGAVKNVLAIAAGIADGLGFGANTRAALISRGLQETMRLGKALGGKAETFMGLAGLGDLVLTCTDNQSRNRRFGLALGKGEHPQTIIKQIGQEIEGISAAKETRCLAVKHNIEMPIIEQTYQVLYQNLPPSTAVRNLLDREHKAES